MHEIQKIVIDVRGVCLSICPSVCLSRGSINSAALCGGHSVQLVLNYFGLLFSYGTAKLFSFLPYCCGHQRLYKLATNLVSCTCLRSLYRERSEDD